jgi:hypothetical protein
MECQWRLDPLKGAGLAGRSHAYGVATAVGQLLQPLVTLAPAMNVRAAVRPMPSSNGRLSAASGMMPYLVHRGLQMVQ